MRCYVCIEFLDSDIYPTWRLWVGRVVVCPDHQHLVLATTPFIAAYDVDYIHAVEIIALRRTYKQLQCLIVHVNC